MNKLVYVGKIIEIKEIEGADFIVSATVVCGSGGKWMGTVKKDMFKVGDLVEVYLQDSLLPIIPKFEFTKSFRYKISMKKFKGVPSEVLIMPLSVEGQLGDDITDVTNVVKYNKPIAASLSGMARGSFPTHLIPKTDEPNFQTLDKEVFDFIRKTKFYSTVKADGSSGTMYRDGDHFGCCSRNLEMKEREENLLWKLAYRYDLKSKLPDKRAIQFEVVGPSIQSNKMKLIDHDLLLFNVWDIENRKYLNSYDVLNMADKLGIKHVSIIEWNEDFKFNSDDELRKYAEGFYPNTKNQREGVVIRPMIEERIGGERVSFKVINLLYKE